ncbi:MAG: hypothetical protein ACR2H4_17695 [Pyrinomonadaceae bacterium]
MIDTAAIFERDRYVVVPALLRQPSLGQVYRYACTMAERGLITSDEQVPNTPSGYGDFIMDKLLVSLLPEIEQSAGLKLFPTCSYFRVYKNGDVLARHTDRPSCEVSVSLCLGFAEDKSWPIWIEGPLGTSSVNLEAGDALLYRGIECAHWREVFEGTFHAQVFLHYVEQNGKYAEWRFDKRDSIAVLHPVIARIGELRGDE